MREQQILALASDNICTGKYDEVSMTLLAIKSRKFEHLFILDLDWLRGTLSENICAGKLSPDRMRKFLDGMAVTLKFGSAEEVDTQMALLRSFDFRMTGNKHILDFLESENVWGAEEIKKAIASVI